MARTLYFQNVTALANYKLQLTTITGNQIRFDFEKRSKTARFGLVRDLGILDSVRTDGHSLIFSKGSKTMKTIDFADFYDMLLIDRTMDNKAFDCRTVGGVLQRPIFHAVRPATHYKLEIDMVTGSTAYIDVRPWLKATKLAPLREAKFFRTVHTDGFELLFGDHDELRLDESVFKGLLFYDPVFLSCIS